MAVVEAHLGPTKSYFKRTLPAGRRGLGVITIVLLLSFSYIAMKLYSIIEIQHVYIRKLSNRSPFSMYRKEVRHRVCGHTQEIWRPGSANLYSRHAGESRPHEGKAVLEILYNSSACHA
jgi:hypothetical protein